jgi:hypothetical protein
MTDEAQIIKYLFEDLRMDIEEIKDFNLKKVNKLAELYGRNINLFYNFLESIK